MFKPLMNKIIFVSKEQGKVKLLKIRYIIKNIQNYGNEK